MKQGRADRSGNSGHKREPMAHGISPKGVSQIGTAVDPKAVESVHAGRGYEAPKAGREVHKAGSQGRHR